MLSVYTVCFSYYITCIISIPGTLIPKSAVDSLVQALASDAESTTVEPPDDEEEKKKTPTPIKKKPPQEEVSDDTDDSD